MSPGLIAKVEWAEQLTLIRGVSVCPPQLPVLNELIAIGNQLAGDKRTVSDVQSDERALTAQGCVCKCVWEGDTFPLCTLERGEKKFPYQVCT